MRDVCTVSETQNMQTKKRESPGEIEQNAFDAIIELISTKCMKASETDLKSDASLVELGAVICQFHPS